MKALSPISAAALAFVSLSSHAFDFVTNGNFNAGLSGWSVPSGTVQVGMSSASPEHGMVAALSSDYALGQLIPLLTSGFRGYTVRFDFRFDASTSQSALVSVEGDDRVLALWTIASDGTSDWRSTSGSFEWAGPVYLSFTKLTGPSFGQSLTLDNISIVSGPVPELSTYALFAGGIAFLVAGRRYPSK